MITISFALISMLLASESSAAISSPSSFREIRARRKGKVLYTLKQGASIAQKSRVRQLLEENNLQIQRKGKIDVLSQPQSLGSSGSQFFGRSFGPQKSEEQLALELMATGAVEYAEPDYLVYPTRLTEDDFNDQYLSYQWHHQTVETFQAWEEESGQRDIVVTVCDSGVESDHPDLRNQLILPGYNTVDGSTRTEPVTNHGTAVTGLIVAERNNAIGVAGIAPQAKVLPVRVSNSSSGSAYLSDLADCIRYGADRGSKVINISYSGAESRTIDSAAKYARRQGSLVFMAAGNSGQNITSTHPDYDSFVLVGATTSDDRRSSFSNYGIPIDLVAPGTQVVTTTINGGYTYISGTSFSSPIAAAVGALVFSVDPDFTPDQVESILDQTADDVGSYYYFGAGRVNAKDAVRLAQRRSQ